MPPSFDLQLSTGERYARAMHPGYARYYDMHIMHERRTEELKRLEKNHEDIKNAVKINVWTKVCLFSILCVLIVLTQFSEGRTFSSHYWCL